MRVLPALFVLCAAALPAQTFQLESQTPPTPMTFGRIALGDVTGDGHADLVNVSWIYSNLVPGSATGTFGAATALPAPLIGGEVRLVDSNGDGQLDIWFCDMNGLSRIESGTQGMAVTAFVGTAQSFACADFDEDGHLDLMLGMPDGPALARNDGTGAYLPLVVFGPYAMAYVSIEAVDLDGDGHLDFLAQPFIGTAMAWRGDGTGNFQSLGTLPVPGTMRVLEVADLDADGDPDVIVGGGTVPSIALLNNGAGAFPVQQPLPSLRDAAVADFDGDGIVDIVGLSGAQLVLALGTGGGTFAAPLGWNVSQASGLVTGDIDGDGRIEAVTMENYSTLAILRDVSPSPVGLTAFGPGMPACGGTIGMSATGAPTVGSTGFRITCTNLPAGARGIVAIGQAGPAIVDAVFGLRVHVFAAEPLINLLADDGGTASFALPIPPLPQLSGVTTTLQSFWLADPRLGNTCSPAMYDLASSRGLTLHIQ